jgi:precorrin-6A/cobalt-precorrin-6A reductase
LILGGTGEAAALAREAVARFGDRLRVTSSLAGRTKQPSPLAGDLRVGGFGGAAGLARYLADTGVAMVIDATHPFAATMSRHGREACDEAHVPRLTLTRPAWRRRAGDDWILVEDAAGAARALAAQGGRAFITIGVQDLGPFENLPGARCLVRLIETPGRSLPFDLVTGRGPFTVAAEMRLLAERNIELLITKASGGAATRAKITAARRLGLPVIMIRRPPLEPGPKARTIAAALEWIGVTISK